VEDLAGQDDDRSLCGIGEQAAQMRPGTPGGEIAVRSGAAERL